jgi:hypothetical protein
MRSRILTYAVALLLVSLLSWASAPITNPTPPRTDGWPLCC